MRHYEIQALQRGLVLLVLNSSALLHAQADATNRPPTVSLVWPRGGEAFTYPQFVKVKTEATDPDDTVVEVKFFAEVESAPGTVGITNVIGVVTNSPFNLLWVVGRLCDYCYANLRVVAADNLGVKATSAPVRIYFSSTRPVYSIVEIVSPPAGTLFPAPATFDFRAELLSGDGSGTIEFFVDTNSVGTAVGEMSATAPPASVMVTNLAEGEHRLKVRFHTISAPCVCDFMSTPIRVVKLGMQRPGVRPDGRFQCEVVTSFPGKETVVQSSPNLLDWFPVSTNRPATNTFTFVEPSPATNTQRFYRVFVPPE